MKNFIVGLVALFCSSTWAACVNPVTLGAVDGAANNTVPLQAAFNYGAANSVAVCIPVGTWKHTGLVGASNLRIAGEGKETILLNTGSGTAIDFTGANNFSVSNLSLQGVATVITATPYPTMTQTGTAIRVSGSYGFKISDLKISYVGTGIDYQANPSWGQKGRFSDIDFSFVYKAVWTSNAGEYANFTNLQVDQSTFGVHVDSGNNIFTGVQVTRSGVGVKLSGGSNNGHGQFIGSTFNHDNYALDAYEAVSLGETFVGCHFVGDITNPGNAGRIRIYNSKGIAIIGGHIGANITIDGGSGTQIGPNMIAHALIRTELPGYVAPQVVNGGIGLFKDNFTLAGIFGGNN